MSDIQELLQRDPLKLTRADRDKIVEFFRTSRKNFVLAGQPSRAPAKAAKIADDVKALDLDLD